jgi:hypothetical protein
MSRRLINTVLEDDDDDEEKGKDKPRSATCFSKSSLRRGLFFSPENQ